MRTSLAFVLLVAACGGGSTKGPEGPAGGGGGGGGGGGAKPAGPGDVSFDVPQIQITGLLFEPEALGRPGMPLAEAKRKTTLDKQRATYDKAAKGKDVVMRQAQAAVLATMLYQDAKKASPDDQTKLYTEARQALRDSVAAAGDKPDETDLRMLGSYELLLNDFAGAEKAWAGLIAADPKDKEMLTNKAWLSYSLLEQYKNTEALDVVKGEQITEKTPELAYVTAWAKFRTGDDKGAWAAMSLAAKGGAALFPHEPLLRDLLLFAGRTGASVDEGVAQLQPLFGKTQQYELLAKLGLESYQYAGRWADGVTALDKAVTAAGGKVPVNDMPVLRFEQADYTVRLDDPVAAAKFGTQAVDALPACGSKCSPSDMNKVVFSVYLTGQLFHVLYATAHDDRYYQPAHDLYAATVPKLTDSTQHSEGMKNADALERSFKAMKAGVGTHTKDAIGALLNRHSQEIQACYERGLAANPKLSGTLTLNLEADQTGAMKGVATEPKAGMQDMAMVAGCVEGFAKGWKLPHRAQAGTTRIKMTYSMAKKG